MNILIVDDHEENLYLLESLLKANGHQVISAPNGAIALEAFGQTKVDLIITDILMPVMDGFQLCRNIRKDPALSAIPLIFYTATYTGPQDEAFALKIGADGFIVKPCEPDVLITAVNEVLASAKKTDGEVSGPEIEEEEAYKLYSERLVSKLEQKMLDAEKEIDARKKAETDLRKSRERLIEAQRLAGMGDFTWDTFSGEVTGSETVFDLLGYDPEEPMNMDRIHAEIHHPDDAVDVAEWARACIDSGEENLSPKEYRVIRKDGKVLNVRTVGRIEKRPDGLSPLVFATIQDITAQKQSEAEKETLQSQLNHAQKMESVGRLAGGVAHDFNNMLGVILGHLEFAMEKAEQNHDLYDDLNEIKNAANRSVKLTKQLLTFARKDIISPKQIDLNDTVESMLNMLRRLIGEDIDLVWKPSTHLWPVKIDPSQIDQILANLCVNARDAIAGVGKLTIETGKKTFDEAYCNENPGFFPGDFVLLAVSDNGSGMDKEILENLFEPFFTTKEVGKGTGLGLATIYGIVKQNNGFINVYSEPGQGSSFKI